MNNKVITITSCKGGVGKTTMTLNLAGIYAYMGKKVLIIDLDLYSSSIAASLNLNPSNDIYTLSDDVANNRFSEFNRYTTKYNSSIDIIAGPKDIRIASRIEAKYMAPIINKAKNEYDVILIDTNYYLNELNLTVYGVSDTILYVLSNNPIDLKNMRSMVTIYADMQRTNYAVLLNESLYKGKHAYTKYEVSKFIKHNIDYYLSDKFYIKDIDKYVLAGKILTLDKKIKSHHRKSISDMIYMADSLLITENKEE